MGLLTKEKTETRTWSAVSAKRARAQMYAEDDLSNLRSRIRRMEAQKEELEAAKAAKLQQAVQGTHYTLEPNLDQCLRDLEDLNRRLGAFKEKEREMAADAEALQKRTAQEAPERAEQQNLLARLARERAQEDSKIDAALEEVRRLIRERGEATDAMRDVAELLAMEMPGGLDESRFESLLGDLPAEMAAESERWLKWFLGEQGEEGELYVVTGRSISLHENLADNGLRLTGQRVRLSPEEVSEVIRRAGENPEPIAKIEAEEAEEAAASA
jgi:hypothetical protein